MAQGVAVSIGHRADQVGAADLVTSSPAVAADNPELAEAARRDLPVVRRAEMLAAIAAARRCLAVAGTHGKTTTCSMLSLMLVEAGLRPSFLIGADVGEMGTNAVWDRGEWLVLEADESYGSFTALAPEMAVVTNVEADHLDHYGTFGALSEAFGAFLDAATGDRLVGADDPVAAELGRRRGAVTVGQAEGATWRITGLTLRGAPRPSTSRAPTGPGGRLEVAVPGLHNARNAALAAAAATLAGAPFGAVAAALSRFAGVPRRFEFRGEGRGVTFVDDYAHLPSEVPAALAAARRGGLAAGGGGLPAPPLHPDRRLGRGVRDGLRRRRRGGGDRRLRRRRPADPRGLGPAGGRRGGRPRPAAPPLRARNAGWRSLSELLGPGDLCLHAGGGRPHHPPRRAAGGRG